MGGAWLLSHVYKHYRFTGDIQPLEKYYDIIYSAVQFYQDFLVDYNGWKLTKPSVSLENSYKNRSISGSMTIGSTIDNFYSLGIIRKSFGGSSGAWKASSA
jgi:alpha-L-fucosidase 2